MIARILIGLGYLVGLIALVVLGLRFFIEKILSGETE